jgi:hypothetical protein
MVLLNVVCFGGGRYEEDKYKQMHGHVRSALESGRIAESGRFCLDEWHDRPRPGMLARPSLITYVPAHGGWLDATSSLGIGQMRTWATFDEFGSIGGRAVVLDACSTASSHWLYDRQLLRAECQSLAGKPLLGGSGVEGPRYRYGAKILGALLDLLTSVEDTAMSDQELLSLLKNLKARAVMKSAPSSKLRTAYAVRMVTNTPSEVW